jgi:hypothetical protein
VLAFAHRAAGDAERSQSHRQEALRQVEQVPPEEREFCRSDLDELGR